MSEVFLTCTAQGLQSGQEYLVEPLRSQDAMVKPAHAIVVPRISDNVWIREANTNTMPETSQKGEYMATLYPDVCVFDRADEQKSAGI